MNYKMKRCLRRAGALAFAAIFALGIPCAPVQASSGAGSEENNKVEELELKLVENPEIGESGPSTRTMLMNCYIIYSCSADGISATLHTGTTQTASVLGVKDVKVEKLCWYGWDTVASAEGLESSNSPVMECSFTYSSAEYGKTYRISCTHYGNVDGYAEVESVTSSFVYQY